MSSPKLIGSPLKRLNKDEMNGIERLHIQLRAFIGVEPLLLLSERNGTALVIAVFFCYGKQIL